MTVEPLFQHQAAYFCASYVTKESTSILLRIDLPIHNLTDTIKG